MTGTIPENEKYLLDVFGSPITDGACVLDEEREIGYVRLQLGPDSFGPALAHWDGWFNVTRTRTENPLKGKVMNGERVQILQGANS